MLRISPINPASVPIKAAAPSIQKLYLKSKQKEFIMLLKRISRLMGINPIAAVVVMVSVIVILVLCFLMMFTHFFL
jgi:hypothetical protein